MGILLGLAPFVVFAVLTRFVSVTPSLWAAAAISAAMILRERSRGRSMKILEVGTFCLFALLGLYSAIIHGNWDIPIVRLAVDVGLLSIIVISLLARRPFTLQYAREQVPAELHRSPVFIRINYVLTSVWAVAMLVMAVADFGMHFVPAVPIWIEVCAIVAAFVGASWFTKWFPQQQRKNA